MLIDQHAPDGVRDDTEVLIQRWYGVDRLGDAITPRFVPSCSAAQLRGAGELAANYSDVWIQPTSGSCDQVKLRNARLAASFNEFAGVTRWVRPKDAKDWL